jgi:hypothetical protein
MVTQPTSMDARRHEIVAEGIHLDHGGHHGRVAIVVSVDALGHGGAGRRLDGHQTRLAALFEVLAQEGQGEATKVGAAANAADDHIGLYTSLVQLHDRFLADDGLVHQHMVEHASQGVIHVFVLEGHFHSFTDGDAQRPCRIGVLGQDGAAGLGFC